MMKWEAGSPGNMAKCNVELFNVVRLHYCRDEGLYRICDLELADVALDRDLPDAG
jgi:hypothetical protein